MKRRSDRNHIVYEITCSNTDERYIGITVVSGQAIQKSIKIRWKRHVYYATVGLGPNPLQQRIREFGDTGFKFRVIKRVRGKQNAHDLERELIKETRPELNVECTSKKQKKTKRRKRKRRKM